MPPLEVNSRWSVNADEHQTGDMIDQKSGSATSHYHVHAPEAPFAFSRAAGDCADCSDDKYNYSNLHCTCTRHLVCLKTASGSVCISLWLHLLHSQCPSQNARKSCP